MAVHFSGEALKFLRGLARHNDREWFNPRKAVYEAELKVPMQALIAEINEGLQRFAPEHVRPPQKAMLRIYRDIRFSANKAPYKTHVAAWWAHDHAAKTSGAGFYLSLSPAGLQLAAGVYKPEKAQLLAIRRHMVEQYAEYHRLLAAKKMKAAFDEMEGNRLTRPPKGFADAPEGAMELVKGQQWGVSTMLPAEVALGVGLVREVLDRFQVAAPLVAFLNAPLASRPAKPMF